MSILDNELVREYFGQWTDRKNSRETQFYEQMSLRVIEAMQQPIKKGDKYLSLIVPGTVSEQVAEVGTLEDFHPYALRLPDRFQKKECGHAWFAKCIKCGEEADLPEEKRPKSAPEPEKCKCFERLGILSLGHELGCPIVKAFSAPEKCEHEGFNEGGHCTICQPGFVKESK